MIVLVVLQQQLIMVSCNSHRQFGPCAIVTAGSVLMTTPALVQFWMNSAYPGAANQDLIEGCANF